MMQKVMTGGACQASDQSQGINQNPFTQMMNNMLTGDAMAKQRAEGQIISQNPLQQENMILMNKQFDQMMNEKVMSQHFDQLQFRQIQQQQQNVQNPFNIQMQQHPANLNQIWDSFEQQNVSKDPVQQNMQQGVFQQQFGGGMNQFSQPWMNPGMMMNRPPQMFQPQLQQNIQQQKEEIIKEQVQEKSAVEQASSNMVNVLENSSDPKLRNCEFLKFLKQLNQGSLKIDENQDLIVDNEKMVEFDQLEVQRLKNEEIRQKEEEQFQKEYEARLKEMQEIDDLDEIQDHHGMDDNQIKENKGDMNRDVLTEEDFNQMMKEWQKNAESGYDLEKEWGKVWEEEALQMGSMFGQPPAQRIIQFQQQNQYKEEQFKNQNLLEKAKQLIEDGKIQEAILCLEAEVQQNKENAEAWRLLGQLFQENDQDEFAIIALRNAHEQDPYDLDSLLSLGISSANELESREAIKYLSFWLKYHPDFNGISVLQKNDELDLNDLEFAFNEANKLRPTDTQVLNALGVIQFIRRDFQKASVYFENAIKDNPIDHTIWNKYGAALANQNKSIDAIQAYRQALDLRPNYVRSLVNLGLATGNQGQQIPAIEAFLNALLLNPKAEHIWVYVRQSMIQANRFDLIEKLDLKDPRVFKGEFNLLDPQNMPPPKMESLYNNKIFQN